MTTITVPDFMFSGFYYPEILESLLAYTRINAEELTSESQYEPHIQMLRSFSLVGHLNNTRVDVVANELLLDSLQLRESLKRLFKLIDYRLSSATPATAELLIKLSSVPLNDISPYIPEDANWGTEQEDGESIIFENTEDKDLDRADQLTSAFAATVTDSGTDGVVDTAYPQRVTSATASFAAADIGRTIAIAKSQNNNAGWYIITNVIDSNNVEVASATFVSETGLVWQVIDFGSDVAADFNDLITSVDMTGKFGFFICHKNIQWNQLDFIVSDPTTDNQVVFLYYDPDYSKVFPNSVTHLGGNYEIVVNSFISPDEIVAPFSDRSNFQVKVRYNPTGRTEHAVVSYDVVKGNYITTKGLFGQSTVDEDPRNYSIFNDWVPCPGQESPTWSANGEQAFVLPMDTNRRWSKHTIQGVEGYWMLCQLSGSPNAPTIVNLKITEGDLFFPFQVTQGQSVSNEVMGSSNGQVNQEFTTLQRPVFDNSYLLEVDETGGGSWVPWIEVQNFLVSGATDRHYKTETDIDDRLVVIFGNGVNGSIPPIGTDNIRISYRVGGDENGNVGSGKITGNDDGIQFVSSVANPMPATGWTIKEGGDEQDLERAKESGPASIRNNGKAVSPGDIPRVAIDEYRTEDGSALVARAFAVEEAYGPKTIELVVVGVGGEFLTGEQLADLATFYNGDRYSVPPVEGVLLLNSELTPINYDPKVVDATYLVIGKGVSPQQIINALTAYLQPLATKEDGSYAHEFGGRVAVVMMDCAVKDVSTSITNVHRSLPTSDVGLGPRQLPNPGIITVAVQETE